MSGGCYIQTPIHSHKTKVNTCNIYAALEAPNEVENAEKQAYPGVTMSHSLLGYYEY